MIDLGQYDAIKNTLSNKQKHEQIFQNSRKRLHDYLAELEKEEEEEEEEAKAKANL